MCCLSTNNFIYQIIHKDLKLGKYSTIYTRFAPEPNGYLHIGHAKSICLNFGIAKYYHGKCNLRFDDTNPDHEDIKYIETIKKDILWLGFKWYGKARYATNYSEQLFKYAIELINKGLAYVDELSINEIREYRGTLIRPGKNSPYRTRDIRENLRLFFKMRDGKLAEGSACLRAKIDMASPFIIMRDPVLYRIKFSSHYKMGNKWCIYPTYDFTHCISDAIEGITHSLCTLEFQDNRQLYNWILQNININSYPRQYEFSRLNLEYMIMSKRQLKILVSKKIVESWDDPRMPTISGLRRRGYTPKSIRKFCKIIGITKQNHHIEISVLENCIRKELNKSSPRVMAILNPVKIIIINLPYNHKENIMMPNHPNRPEMGTRTAIFSREIIIDYSDFCEQITNNKKYKKLILGNEIRLRYAYIIKAEKIEKDDKEHISTIYCSYDPTTLNKNPADGRKIQGVIHWLSCMNIRKAEFRLYNPLFKIDKPYKTENPFLYINQNSLVIYNGFIEKNILNTFKTKYYQFEREGYFCIDYKYSSNYKLVFNRTVELKNNLK